MTKALFETIARDQLADAVGGETNALDTTLISPVGYGRNKTTTSREPSETCMANNVTPAYEAFPDNRWFWQRWRGDPDPNARARAEWLTQKNQACLSAAK